MYYLPSKRCSLPSKKCFHGRTSHLSRTNYPSKTHHPAKRRYHAKKTRVGNYAAGRAYGDGDARGVVGGGGPGYDMGNRRSSGLSLGYAWSAVMGLRCSLINGEGGRMLVRLCRCLGSRVRGYLVGMGGLGGREGLSPLLLSEDGLRGLTASRESFPHNIPQSSNDIDQFFRFSSFSCELFV